MVPHPNKTDHAQNFRASFRGPIPKSEPWACRNWRGSQWAYCKELRGRVQGGRPGYQHTMVLSCKSPYGFYWPQRWLVDMNPREVSTKGSPIMLLACLSWFSQTSGRKAMFGGGLSISAHAQVDITMTPHILKSYQIPVAIGPSRSTKSASRSCACVDASSSFSAWHHFSRLPASIFWFG